MKAQIRNQYLTFNGIKLVSIYSDEFPFDQAQLQDMWCIPGRELMRTDALIALANKRNVPLTHTVFTNGISTTTQLN